LQSIEDLIALSDEIYDSLEKEIFPMPKLMLMDTYFDLLD